MGFENYAEVSRAQAAVITKGKGDGVKTDGGSTFEHLTFDEYTD